MMICRASADTLPGGVLRLHPVCEDCSVLDRGERVTGHNAYSTQRMISAFGLRYDEVGSLRMVAHKGSTWNLEPETMLSRYA
jgi:hypothetical protein